MSADELTPEKLIELYKLPLKNDVSILKGINDIGWERLAHAHGSAYDVPALLRAAISPIKNHRDFAFVLLHETIWHQGTIYQASAYVVPFLHALMQADDAPDRDGPAFLLASLVNGYSEDPHIVSKTWAAAEPSIYSLLPYIRHHDPSFRATIAQALSHYPQYKAILLPELTTQLSAENNEYTVMDLQKAIETLQYQ